MPTLKAKVVKIGNSKGIRLPKVLMEQYDITDEVELEPRDDALIIKPVKTARKGWDTAFREMHHNEDDIELIDDDVQTEWEKSEWEW